MACVVMPTTQFLFSGGCCRFPIVGRRLTPAWPRRNQRPRSFPARRVEVLGDCGSVKILQYERLLRGSAAAKGLSRCGRLHHRRGIHHSNRFRGFPGMGIPKLGISLGSRASADGISNRIDSGLGLRCHSARYSRNSGAHHI